MENLLNVHFGSISQMSRLIMELEIQPAARRRWMIIIVKCRVTLFHLEANTEF